MTWLWRGSALVPAFFSFVNEPDSVYSRRHLFFLSLSYIQNPVVQNQLHSRFIIFTLIYMLQSILHVVHDLEVYDVF